jgi:diaminopimelate decarboxylase
MGLWGLGSNENGHMTVGGLDVIDLLEDFGSPLLVVNESQLKEDMRQMMRAFDPAPLGSKILYSYKTNCIPGVLKQIHMMGIGAEVISPYELWLAEKLGVCGDLIAYNGVNKTEESIERAARLNILTLNIDHLDEIEKIYQIAKKMNRMIRVGIRLALNTNSQFGLEIESWEALKACRNIACHQDYLDLVCVHFNVTSNARSASLHKVCAQEAIKFVAHVRKEIGLTIRYLDIGGGFGVPTTKNMSGFEYGIYRMMGCPPKPPSLYEFQSMDSFFNEILNSIRESCHAQNVEVPIILIEPGRAITSRSEFLLTRVLAVKQKANGKRFMITDAGRLSIAFPCDFEYHEVFLANRPAETATTPYQIMGRVCTSADWMFKNRLLPEINPGDVLAVMDAGAYFSSYSTNFSFPRPSIIMVSNGRAQVIRHEETFEHLIGMDTF